MGGVTLKACEEKNKRLTRLPEVKAASSIYQCGDDFYQVGKGGREIGGEKRDLSLGKSLSVNLSHLFALLKHQNKSQPSALHRHFAMNLQISHRL